MDYLEQRLIARWQIAAIDLDIRVTAPIELRDASGVPFFCEAFLPDFGSTNGAVIASVRTERHIRNQLRSLNDTVYTSIAERKLGPTYNRKSAIEELLDHGWFGKLGDEPNWYMQRQG